MKSWPFLLLPAILSIPALCPVEAASCSSCSPPTPNPGSLATDAVVKQYLAPHRTFIEQSASPAGDLQAFVEQLPGLASQQRPALIYLYSQGPIPPNDPQAPLLSQAFQACAIVEQNLLYTRPFHQGRSNAAPGTVPPSSNTSHDFRVALACSFFHCLSVNLYPLQPDDNPSLNRLTAPILLLTNAQGRIVHKFAGARHSPAAVFNAMARLMARQGDPDFSNRINQANRALNNVYRIQYRMQTLGRLADRPDVQAQVEQLQTLREKALAQYQQALQAIQPAPQSAGQQ